MAMKREYQKVVMVALAKKYHILLPSELKTKDNLIRRNGALATSTIQ